MNKVSLTKTFLIGAGVLGAVLARPAVAADAKVTYEDHVMPVLRNACLKCHNPDKLKGDLDLSTFAGVLKGGGSGPGVVSGDPDGSKLMKAITHAEEPAMPPSSGKLPDKEIDIFRKWIAGGLLENSGSKAVASSKPKVDLTVAVNSVGKPDGPPPMPKDLLMEPHVHAARAGVATGLANSPWAPLIALGGQKQVLLYHSDTLELLGVLPYAEGYPSDLKFSRNAKLLLSGGGKGSKSGQVVVWDVTTGERVMTVGDEFDSVLAADISSDQKYVALGGPSKLVKIYATKTGELLHKMKKHTDWVTALEFSPNGKYLATGDRNGGVVVWDSENGVEAYSFTGHRGAITAVTWRGDSDIMASASEDGTIKLWKMSDGEMAKSMTVHSGGVLAARFAHDGKLVSCGRDNQVAVWAADGNKLKSLTYTNELPVRVAFSHDGARVVVGDFAGRVSVWNAADMKSVGDLDLNPASLTERIAAAEKLIPELEAKVANSPASLMAADADVARLKAETDKAVKGSPAAKELARQLEAATKKLADLRTETEGARTRLAHTKASLERMKVGVVFSAVYRAREKFAGHQRELEQLKADAEAAKAAGEKAAADLAAAKKLKPASREEKAALAKRIKALGDLVKASGAKAAAATSAAGKLTRSMVSEQAQVEKLSAEYERIKSASLGGSKSASL